MIRYRLICTTPTAAPVKGRGKARAGQVATTAPRGRSKRGCGAEFESWFQNSTAFDALLARGQVTCPACGSPNVEKTLMAPSVKTTKGKTKAIAAPPVAPNNESAAPTGRQLASLTPEQRAFVETMRKVRTHVMANSEDVGDRFAEEARKIHYEESEARSIRGAASFEEAKALVEEGIDILPIPELPDDRN